MNVVIIAASIFVQNLVSLRARTGPRTNTLSTGILASENVKPVRPYSWFYLKGKMGYFELRPQARRHSVWKLNATSCLLISMHELPLAQFENFELSWKFSFLCSFLWSRLLLLPSHQMAPSVTTSWAKIMSS